MPTSAPARCKTHARSAAKFIGNAIGHRNAEKSMSGFLEYQSGERLFECRAL
jgi:hypothetical protein